MRLASKDPAGHSSSQKVAHKEISRLNRKMSVKIPVSGFLVPREGCIQSGCAPGVGGFNASGSPEESERLACKDPAGHSS